MLRQERGVTLVEVMAAMVISLIIMSAAFTALISSQKAARVNELIAHTQQNSRIAIELIARDIKMAGFGMTGAVGACNTGIVPNDENPNPANNAGGDRGPDSISLVVPTTQTIAPAWRLAATETGPFTVMTLQVGAVTSMAAAGLVSGVNGSTVSIGGALSGRVQAFNPGTDTITLTNEIGAPKQFPGGTQIFLLDCVSYTIAACGGNAPCLVRDGVALVEGIEDLQFAYACDGCVNAVNGGVPDGIPDDQEPDGVFSAGDFVSNSTWALAPMTADKIRLVQVNVVARQSQQDQGLDERGRRAQITLGPVIVNDHDPADDAGFVLANYQLERRRLLTRTVQTRNTGP